MRFHHTRIEALGRALPDRVVRSDELEERLGPVYERLGLRVGRLELMTGIRERRHFEPGTRPSEVAARAGERAIERSGVDRGRIGCLIHSSVCRDFLEPATASVVHHRLGLSEACTVYDLSNACLGFANSMVAVAGMIDRGDIEAGLVVSGEDGGPLVEQTVQWLLETPSIGKKELKSAFASLTIGSGAAAAVLVHERLSRGGRPLLGGALRSDTSNVELCQGGTEGGGAGPLMETDSEAMLLAGNALARRTWEAFERELDWSRDSAERIVTHQVGSAHRRLLFETLELDLARDFPTGETLGNVGSASLPLSLDLGEEAGFVGPEHAVALLGIGSGLNCLMLGLGPRTG